MFKTVGVVGAGLMGSEIALVFALAGRRVKLNDTNPALLDESANDWRESCRRVLIEAFIMKMR